MALRQLPLRVGDDLVAALDRAAVLLAPPGERPDRSKTARLLLWRALEPLGILPPSHADPEPAGRP
jgi:hypothetical protein